MCELLAFKHSQQKKKQSKKREREKNTAMERRIWLRELADVLVWSDMNSLLFSGAFLLLREFMYRCSVASICFRFYRCFEKLCWRANLMNSSKENTLWIVCISSLAMLHTQPSALFVIKPKQKFILIAYIKQQMTCICISSISSIFRIRNKFRLYFQ